MKPCYYCETSECLRCIHDDKGDQYISNREKSVDVDWLSNVIRAADGEHKLGAGALAEKIVAAILGAKQ
jgi:hypothetical protein